MKPTLKIQDYLTAHQEAQAFTENNQQIIGTFFSCPKCGERFGFSRAVFGSHATAETLESIAVNPAFGPNCEFYSYCESLPRAQPKEPLYSVFTPAPDYERFTDEIVTQEGSVMRFEKATTHPSHSAAKCPTHREIVDLEADGENQKTVRQLRIVRDWKDRRASEIESLFAERPIVFETTIAAVFRCRQCNIKSFVVIF